MLINTSFNIRFGKVLNFFLSKIRINPITCAEQKIIKDVNFDLIAAFIFYPIITLSNSRLCKNLDLGNQTIEDAFGMAWDAIKL